MLRRRALAVRCHGVVPFAARHGHEAERFEIAEPPCERILEQTRRQRRGLAPATRPDQCEDLWFRLGGEQDQQGAADLDQVKPTSRTVRLRCHMAPTPSVSLRAANSGSTVQRLA